jgi:hypothetical protein
MSAISSRYGRIDLIVQWGDDVFWWLMRCFDECGTGPSAWCGYIIYSVDHDGAFRRVRLCVHVSGRLQENEGQENEPVCWMTKLAGQLRLGMPGELRTSM